jgi:hypothetical protein
VSLFVLQLQCTKTAGLFNVSKWQSGDKNRQRMKKNEMDEMFRTESGKKDSYIHLSLTLRLGVHIPLCCLQACTATLSSVQRSYEYCA